MDCPVLREPSELPDFGNPGPAPGWRVSTPHGGGASLGSKSRCLTTLETSCLFWVNANTGQRHRVRLLNIIENPYADDSHDQLNFESLSASLNGDLSVYVLVQGGTVLCCQRPFHINETDQHYILWNQLRVLPVSDDDGQGLGPAKKSSQNLILKLLGMLTISQFKARFQARRQI